MTLRIIGAGLPRTGTRSLREALSALLGGPCLHMSAIAGHPFDLGDGWRHALAGGAPDWPQLLSGYVAAVDWPAAQFWRELSAAYPDAPVLLSVRESAEVWWQSLDATILPIARLAREPGWNEGRDLLTLLERFAGTADWDDPALLMAAYERHNTTVRATIPPGRLVEWRAEQGWPPICAALGLPLPERPFPWANRRSEWG